MLVMPCQAQSPQAASLQADRVNVRCGPGLQYHIEWTYQRKGWPVQIMESFENWRKITDPYGIQGWVQRNMLSPRTTALVTQLTFLHPKADSGSKPMARLEKGVIAILKHCEHAWCFLQIPTETRIWKGWVRKSVLWRASNLP